MRLKHILFTLIVLIVVSSLSMGATDYILKSLNVRDGLSQNTVNAILRDSRGFLWIGTNHGVNRYDNNSIRQFISTDAVGKVTGSHTLSFYEDKTGCIWICADNGLVRYYPDEDRMRLFVEENGSPIYTEGAIVGNDSIIFGGKGYIAVYDFSTDSLHVRYHEEFPDARIREFLPWNDGKYLAVTRREGLWLFDPLTETMQPYAPVEIKSIMSAAVDSLSQLWVAVYGDALYKYDKDGNLLAEFSDKNGLNTSMITDLLPYNGKGMMVSSEKGIESIDLETNRISNNPFDDAASKLGAIRSMYCDEYGNFYAGTVRNGVAMLQQVSIRTFAFGPSDKLEMSVTSIIPGDGILWCGVDGNGVYKFDTETSTLTHVPSTAGHKNVGMADWPGNKLVYACYCSDFYLVDKKTLARTPVPAFLKRISDNAHAHEIGVEIFNISDSVLAFISDSIYFVYPYTGRVDVAVPDSADNLKITGKMQYLYSDDNQLMTTWFHTVYRADRNTLKLEKVTDAPYGQIYNGRYDGKNNLYFATADTIYHYDMITGESDPISLSAVNNIGSMEIVNGMIWFGASNQLFVTDGLRLISFNEGDGVVPNEFLPNVSYADSNYIYFGGTSGIARVNRKELAINQNKKAASLQISLSELDINGVPSISRIKNGVVKIPSHNALVRVKVVNKEANQIRSRMYRFYLDGLNFDHPVEMIDPILTLGELPAGKKITVRVSCTLPDGEWSTPKEIITFDVAQLWWRSWWFMVLVIIGVALIAIGVYRVLLQSWKNNANRHRLHVLERDVQILANINDGMRAPIASVAKPIHEVLDQLACDEEIDHKQLENDLSNALGNLEVMQSMVDNPFGMLHPQNMSIEPVMLSARFNVWLSEQIEKFIKAQRSNVHLSVDFHPETDAGMITFNSSRMEMIITCLLSELVDAGTKSLRIVISEEDESGFLKIMYGNAALLDNAKWNVAKDETQQSLMVMYARWLAEVDGIDVISAYNDSTLAAVAMVFKPEKASKYIEPVAVSRIDGGGADAKESLRECSMVAMYTNLSYGETLQHRLKKDFKAIYIEDSPAKAFERICEVHPEVVIVDGSEATDEAVDLCIRLKSDTDLPDMAIIVITDGNAGRIREKTGRYGGDAYIERPFDRNVMLSLCRHLLGLE